MVDNYFVYRVPKTTIEGTTEGSMIAGFKTLGNRKFG
jgi:hypothetical protein